MTPFLIPKKKINPLLHIPDLIKKIPQLPPLLSEENQIKLEMLLELLASQDAIPHGKIVQLHMLKRRKDREAIYQKQLKDYMIKKKDLLFKKQSILSMLEKFEKHEKRVTAAAQPANISPTIRIPRLAKTRDVRLKKPTNVLWSVLKQQATHGEDINIGLKKPTNVLWSAFKQGVQASALNV